MYAPNSALLNALAHNKINFKQVLEFILSRYDFTPTAFQNGDIHNAANDNQGSCKVFCFAHLNNFSALDTLALFAEYYRAVLDQPKGNDHQNIRQFMHHGWAGVKLEGHALTPKQNIDQINAHAASLYEGGGSEFTALDSTVETDQTDTATQNNTQDIEDNKTQSMQATPSQPGATPVPNPPSDEVVENTQNLTEPSAPKDADGSISNPENAADTTVYAMSTEPQIAEHEIQNADAQVAEFQVIDVEQTEVPAVQNTAPRSNDSELDEKAILAMQAAQAANAGVIPPSPGSSNSMTTETTFYTDNDSVTQHTAAHQPIDDFIHYESANTQAEPVESEPLPSEPVELSTLVPATVSVNNMNSEAKNTESKNTDPTATASASASELAQSNAGHSADNPAAFIEDNQTSDDGQLATTESSQPNENTVQTAKDVSTVDSQPATDTTIHGDNASGLASVSASDIAHNNTTQVTDNPAAFIEEKNTSTDADAPATTDKTSS